MAFGIDKKELRNWKKKVLKGEIAFLTHYWLDERFPGCDCLTKVGCSNIKKLATWGKKYGLKEEWIHKRDRFPHYDLFGDFQKEILQAEEQWDQIEKFDI